MCYQISSVGQRQFSLLSEVNNFGVRCAAIWAERMRSKSRKTASTHDVQKLGEGFARRIV